MKPAPPAFLAPLLAQPAAILGGGVSGRAAHLLVGRLGGEAVLYDAHGAGGGRVSFSAVEARAHRLVVYSPGFAPEHPWLAAARAAGCVCLAELDLAALCWRGAVVAVTGTNGKTTLAEFLAHALRALGRDATACGNTGHAFAALAAEAAGGTADATAVVEVSSFQAEALQHFRPDAVLWTNFAEDHLERHGTMERYFGAKWNLLARATPAKVFAGPSVARFAARFARALPPGALVATERQPPDPRWRGTAFEHCPQRENVLIAAAWWRAAGHDAAALVAAARSFRLGDHRLAPVAERAGVTWWDDSKATNFHAVEAALAGFAAPVLAILGGKSKGGDLTGFVARAAPRIRHALLIGETRRELAAACTGLGVEHTDCGDLAAAVRRAAALARPGEHVLLSPAFASFDQFNGYADRGAQFVALVRALPAAPGAPVRAPLLARLSAAFLA
jgi:UDP-N-acetylmuramoylalanine--D-glutamate ligase